MRTRIVLLFVGLLAPLAAVAQAPAGATGQCKDNSYTTAAKKWQACSGHKGVQTWYADGKPGATPASAGTTPAAAPVASSAAPAKVAAAPSSSPGAAAPATKAAGARTAAAAGGGPGLVWVNTATNVYHCPGGTFYGKTKEGKYMSEADAKSAGARPDRNKACGK